MPYKYDNQKQFKPIRQKLRKQMPKGEVILWKKLQREQLGYKFRRQYSIGNFVVDFYCVILKFVIEVDGFSHSGDVKSEYDTNRQKYLESLGITVKRFRSSEVFGDVRGVVEQIYHACVALEKGMSIST